MRHPSITEALAALTVQRPPATGHPGVLPTLYLTGANPPTEPTDFIGPARDAALRLRLMVAHALANGCPPLKLFYGGPSGTGKSALTYYAQRLFRVSRFAVYEFNGTDVSIDRVRELRATLGLTHNELFGLYRLICIQEADRIPDAAQVNMLTLLDNLPHRTAVICTSNADLAEMERRFQRRFKYTRIDPPPLDELLSLLRRWDAPEFVCRMIATGACGNVGLAMNELEEWLQTHPASEPPTPATPPPQDAELALA